MSRSIQIGDIAFINVDGQEYSLNIVDVRPTYIRAGEYILIPMGNDWIVQDYPKVHSIRFVGLPLSTHIPEITSQILLPLSYVDLMNICKTNKDLNKICQDDHFWKLKVERDYGTIADDKPSNITYRQQYLDLMTIKDPNEAVEQGRLDILKWLSQNNIYPNEDGVYEAIRHGQLKTLQWLVQTAGANINQNDVNDAAAHGQLAILRWLAQEKNLYPNRDGVNWATQTGQLEALKWVAQTIGLYPDQDDADDAAANGHLEILTWLAQHNIYPNR